MVDHIQFYREVGRLKSLPRTGWKKRGIESPESVADHMLRTQYIVFDLAKATGEDPHACAFIMMVHDLAEAKVGDLTPDCGVSKQEKARLELEAAIHLADLSGNPEYLTAYKEYAEGKTLRARICSEADKLECLVQVVEYMEQYPDKIRVFDDFWPYAEAKVVTDLGREMFDNLARQRDVIFAVHNKPSVQLSV